MSSYFKQKLNENEEPLLLLRRHPATFWWPVLRTICFGLIPVPFLGYAFTYLWSTLIVIGWWVFVLIWFLVSWFIWYFNITLVTSQRILDIKQTGPFTRRVREVAHDKITEINFEIRGLVATIFGYGNIRAHFDGEGKPIVINSIASPEVVKDQLLKVQEYVKVNSGQQAGITPQDLKNFAREIASGEKKVPVRINNDSEIKNDEE